MGLNNEEASKPPLFLKPSGAKSIGSQVTSSLKGTKNFAANLAQKLGSNEIPFWELPTLGGNDWMRGFLNGRLRGPSTVTAALAYRYPCWIFLDAELFTEVGNAFGEKFDGFAPERLFLSYGFALRSNVAPQTPVGLTVAFASNRFDSPAFRLLDVTRFTVGVSHAY